VPVTTVDVTTPDGVMDVTLHEPEGGPAPTVIFFSDAGGVRPVMQEMAARLAHTLDRRPAKSYGSGMSLIYQLVLFVTAGRRLFFDQSLTVACELQRPFVNNPALNLLLGQERV